MNFSWKKLNWWTRFPIILFVIGSIFDLFFTTRNYLVLDYLPELNPLLGIVKNYWIFLIINILMCIALIMIYFNTFNSNKTTLNNRYLLFSICLLTGILRFIGALSNASWIGHEEMNATQIELLKETVTTQGVQVYSGIVFNWLIYPFLITYIIFFLFNKAMELEKVIKK